MFDYLILGGGMAGCRLAARLSEDASVQVGLLEAGPPPSTRKPRPAWDLPTVAQAGLNGRVVRLAPGQGLGGTAAWTAPGAPRSAGGTLEAAFAQAAAQAALPLDVGTDPREGAPQAEAGGPPARPNLQVFTGALAVRVLLQGLRAVGVEFHREGLVQRLQARREVLLCAGALQSPLLLMRSGIGPHAPLVQAGVGTRLDLPGVGLHLHVPVQLRLQPARGAGLLRLHRPRRAAPAGMAAEAAAAAPDGVALRLLPGAALLVAVASPASRGSLGLAGKDPYLAPRLDPDLLSEREDLQALAHGVALARRVMAQAPVAAQGLRPARAWSRLAHDLALEQFVRDHAEPGPGAAGTCRMGEGPLDVVDAQLRVRGIEGLRVADASVLPALPAAGGRAAALQAVAEHAARVLRAG